METETSIGEMMAALQEIETRNNENRRRCDIQDGILKIRDILKQREESRWVIVAPEAIRNTIIDAFHNHPLGHRGIAQTALAIRSAWWWPNQIGDVKNRLSDGCDIGVYGFSRYPFIVPIKTKNTEEIVQELEWIFASHGVPSILMHDRGKEFEAEVKLLCESQQS